jgi:hypothetical protein
MIRHIVFFSAKLPEDIPVMQEGLAILGGIPHARNFEVGRNAKMDQWSTEADLVVYCEFDDEAAFHAFKAHPLYQESIRRVRHLRDMRVAADYNTELAMGVAIPDRQAG